MASFAEKTRSSRPEDLEDTVREILEGIKKGAIRR